MASLAFFHASWRSSFLRSSSAASAAAAALGGTAAGGDLRRSRPLSLGAPPLLLRARSRSRERERSRFLLLPPPLDFLLMVAGVARVRRTDEGLADRA